MIENMNISKRNSHHKQMAPLIVLFPFMSKGHTIPLLHLAQLLLHRSAAVTIFTTPANHPFISQSLSPSPHLSITILPFPDNIDGIPNGVENTEQLPSMSLFGSFVNAVKLMQPPFEDALHEIHSQVSFIVSDGFLPWTLQSASKLGIPRLCYYGMSYYAHAVGHEARANGLLSLHESDDEPFTLPKLPWINLTRNHFNDPFNRRNPSGPALDFTMEAIRATESSHGLLMNTFRELEPIFSDYCDRERQPKTWAIGPLCLTKLHKNNKRTSDEDDKPKYWMDWLDKKSSQGSPVLYVAFGSQANISSTQVQVIARALEESRVGFLWVVKKQVMMSDSEYFEGYEERVRGRGCIVSDWVDQEEILEHEMVQGFMSHCGWNSVLEGICAGVPILAWPIMADQYFNAKMVAEEIKIGLRVDTVDGSARGFVTSDSLKKTVTELMEGGKGMELRAKVKEVAETARRAVAEGGSSWHALNQLINDMHIQRETFSLK